MLYIADCFSLDAGRALQERVPGGCGFVVHVYLQPHGDNLGEEEGKANKHDGQGVGAQDGVLVGVEENGVEPFRQILNPIHHHARHNEKQNTYKRKCDLLHTNQSIDQSINHTRDVKHQTNKQTNKQ